MDPSRLTSAGIFLLCSLCGWYACLPDQEVEANLLERQVIITWIALERGDADIALTYAREAHANWHRLRRTYGHYTLPAREQRSVAILDHWTNGLLDAVNARQTSSALLAATLIRAELQNIRPHYQPHHPADALYTFHQQWQAVVEASHDQMMCRYEWAEFEELIEKAQTTWRTYQASQPRYVDDLFPGYGSHSYAVEDASLAINQALAEFSAILPQGDHTLAARPSKDLEALFFDYLALLVDYPLASPGLQ